MPQAARNIRDGFRPARGSTAGSSDGHAEDRADTRAGVNATMDMGRAAIRRPERALKTRAP